MKTDPVRAKRRLRAEIKEKASRLDPDYVAFSDKNIAENVINYAPFKSAAALFCYVSMPGEPDTGDIIDAALKSGKAVFVPYTEGDNMFAVPLKSRTALVPGRFNVPVPEPADVKLTAEELSGKYGKRLFCVIPCVTASPAGDRLGRGGGFYDRFLQKTGGFGGCVLVRHKLLAEDVPHGEKDVRIPAVATENGIIAIDTNQIPGV